MKKSKGSAHRRAVRVAEEVVAASKSWRRSGPFLWARLTAGGAIVGVSLYDIAAQAWGWMPPIGHEAAGGVSAAIGASVAAVAVKVLHIV